MPTLDFFVSVFVFVRSLRFFARKMDAHYENGKFGKLGPNINSEKFREFK